MQTSKTMQVERTMAGQFVLSTSWFCMHSGVWYLSDGVSLLQDTGRVGLVAG